MAYDFYPFNLYVCLYLNHVSCRQYKKARSGNLCLFIGVFEPFTFCVISFMIWLKPTILLFFSVYFLCFLFHIFLLSFVLSIFYYSIFCVILLAIILFFPNFIIVWNLYYNTHCITTYLQVILYYFTSSIRTFNYIISFSFWTMVLLLSYVLFVYLF